FSRDWSSDVCSSDLAVGLVLNQLQHRLRPPCRQRTHLHAGFHERHPLVHLVQEVRLHTATPPHLAAHVVGALRVLERHIPRGDRSEERRGGKGGTSR